jgi:hypothetical protein
MTAQEKDPITDSGQGSPQLDSFHKRILAWMKDKVFGGIVLAIVFGLFAFWNSRAPDVRYTVGAVDSKDGQVGQVEVTIRNIGSTSAEDIDCEIKVTASEITAIEPEPSILNATITIDSDNKRAIVHIPRLNTQDTIKLSIIGRNPFQIDKTLAVAVHGKDLIATKDNGKPSSFWGIVILYGMCAVVLLLVAISSTVSNIKKELAAKRVLRFVNGPLAGKWITGELAVELYDSMSEGHTMLTVQNTEYIAFASRKDDAMTVLELASCDELPLEQSSEN